MPKQTRLEKAIMRLAKAAGEIQRAAAEIKEAVGKPAKTPRTVMCEKCESEMEEQPLERTVAGNKERLYRCPKCKEEKWVKEE